MGRPKYNCVSNYIKYERDVLIKGKDCQTRFKKQVCTQSTQRNYKTKVKIG